MAEKEDITKTKSFTFWTLKKIKYVDCQSVIVGKVTGQIRFFEHLHLLGAHGLHRLVRVYQLLEVDVKQHLYGLVIDDDVAESVENGFVFTDCYIEIIKNVHEVSNDYLHFLLEGINKGHYELLDDTLRELANHCHLISIFEADRIPYVTINEKKYYPLFTSYEELKKYDKTSHKYYIFPLSNYMSIVEKEKDIEGIIINYASDKRNILLNQEMLYYIQKAKIRHLHDYAKIKETHSRNRKQGMLQ
ncbi:SseB family protein [[Clostridium] spiroforme]|nr:SseB family protein [Thomasclavelia spiroformis]